MMTVTGGCGAPQLPVLCSVSTGMLSCVGRSYSLCDGVSRRRMLQVGSLGMLGLTLGDLFALRAAGAASGKREVSCILLWLTGGPSQYETWDPKPDAPAEIRGPYAAIETNVSGIRISELLPQLARRADRYAILRSGSHPTEVDHDGGHRMLLTGYRAPNLDFPHMGAVAARFTQPVSAVPPWIMMPQQVRIANVTLGALG